MRWDWTPETRAKLAVFLETRELPSILDPPEGRIVTANNRIVGDGSSVYIAGDYMNGYRAARIEEMLDTVEVDAGFAARMQTDVLSLPARSRRTAWRACASAWRRGTG